MTTRRKFSKEFKSKVVLEALKERETLEGLGKKYELEPTQISLWKTQAMRNFSIFFFQMIMKRTKKKMLKYNNFTHKLENCRYRTNF
jgi:transposase-like protein